MQYLVIFALLFSLLAWLANTYHRLAQLHTIVSKSWERLRSVMKERNAALREFTYLLSIHEEAEDPTLRQLRRTENDLASNLNHGELNQLQDNEAKLQEILASFKNTLDNTHKNTAPSSSLQQAYHLVLLYDDERKMRIARYNDSVARYNKVLEIAGYHIVGGIFHFEPQQSLLLES